MLGADDKAGVSEIMTALEYFVSHPDEKHGEIEVIFSPDEETGHGMDNVPLNLIKSKCAYTVDGGHVAELETECFNAYKSDVVFTGKALHTGSARPNMINAINMVSSFVQSLPHHQMVLYLPDILPVLSRRAQGLIHIRRFPARQQVCP